MVLLFQGDFTAVALILVEKWEKMDTSVFISLLSWYMYIPHSTATDWPITLLKLELYRNCLGPHWQEAFWHAWVCRLCAEQLCRKVRSRRSDNFSFQILLSLTPLSSRKRTDLCADETLHSMFTCARRRGWKEIQLLWYERQDISWLYFSSLLLTSINNFKRVVILSSMCLIRPLSERNDHLHWSFILRDWVGSEVAAEVYPTPECSGTVGAGQRSWD